VVSFRKCEICGRSLDGLEGEQHEVENRRVEPAENALLQREVPHDLPSEAVCDDCLAEYRRKTGSPPAEERPGE
jgi:hypothetical protein